MIQFLWGGTTVACWVAGLFLLRFWRETGDRLFVLFAVAFWVLSISWLLLAAASPTSEFRAFFISRGLSRS